MRVFSPWKYMIDPVAPHMRYGHRVTAITRSRFDKVKSAGRDDAPFEVVSVTDAGDVRVQVQAVIDASGTFTTPNPLGAGGIPIEGEAVERDRIMHGIPDVFGRDRARYAGRRVLVVGSGHSAFNALLDLAWLKTDEPACCEPSEKSACCGAANAGAGCGCQ